MDLGEALQRAWDARSPLHERVEHTDCYRILDGRFEGAAGWTVDRFGSVALVRRYGEPASADALVSGLQSLLGPGAAVVLRQAGQDADCVAGELPAAADDDPLGGREGRLVVREEGLRFGVDLFYGRNPGLFLDAREPRQLVRERSAGRRILNLFSYTSAFGVAAAAGGARSVTNVDIVRSALDRGRVNFALNGLPSDPRTHMRSEVFDFVKKARQREESWDGLILDPPPVRTPGRGRGWDPARDFSRLVEAAMQLRSEGAWLLVVCAVRGRERFEDRLPDGEWFLVERGFDFPGPLEEGARAWMLSPASSGQA